MGNKQIRTNKTILQIFNTLTAQEKNAVYQWVGETMFAGKIVKKPTRLNTLSKIQLQAVELILKESLV